MDVKQRFSKSIKSSVGSGSFVVEFSMAVEGFVRSTWCLSYFRASRGPHSRDDQPIMHSTGIAHRYSPAHSRKKIVQVS